MQARSIAEGVALGVVWMAAILMIPDFMRYMKIRSM
jgi:hypothetical protein